MLTINHATVDQMKTAFKSNQTSVVPMLLPTTVPLPMEVLPPSTMELVEEKSLTTTVPVPTVETTKFQMIQTMSVRSKMNLEWSEK